MAGDTGDCDWDVFYESYIFGRVEEADEMIDPSFRSNPWETKNVKGNWKLFQLGASLLSGSSILSQNVGEANIGPREAQRVPGPPVQCDRSLQGPRILQLCATQYC